VLKDLGLTNLPLHDFTQNQVWVETVLLAADLLAWTRTSDSPSTAGPNPNGSACGCSTSPRASSPTQGRPP